MKRAGQIAGRFGRQALRAEAPQLPAFLGATRSPIINSPTNSRSFSTKPSKIPQPPEANIPPQIPAQEDLAGEDEVIAKAAAEMFAIFFSGFAWSAALQAPITFALHLMIAKMRRGEGYDQTAQKLFGLIQSKSGLQKLGYESVNTFKRRSLASVLPNSVVASIINNYGLSPVLGSLSIGIFESGVNSLKEPQERFNMSNKAKSFAHIDGKLNLLTITEKEFDEQLAKYEGDKTDLKSYAELEELRETFKENANLQKFAIFMRNFIFALAVLTVAPVASKFVEENSDEIFAKTGIPKEYQTKILTNVMRCVLALVSTVPENLLIQSSSGEVKFSDLKNKPFSSYFTGGLSRIVVVYLAATTIAEGIKTGRNMSEIVNQSLHQLVENFQELSQEFDDKLSPQTQDVMRRLADDEEYLKDFAKLGGVLSELFSEAASGFEDRITEIAKDPTFGKRFLTSEPKDLKDMNTKPSSQAIGQPLSAEPTQSIKEKGAEK
ncbi:MAG: hypothetical protein V4612_06970 [Pseudomonadota bacterium]